MVLLVMPSAAFFNPPALSPPTLRPTRRPPTAFPAASTIRPAYVWPARRPPGRAVAPRNLDGPDQAASPTVTVSRLPTGTAPVDRRCSGGVVQVESAPDLAFRNIEVAGTFFEGAADKHPKARRGHSKEERCDCPYWKYRVFSSQFSHVSLHR